VIPLIYLLNLFDAASTHYLIGADKSFEMNPFMHLIISTSWWWFWFIKIIVMGLACLVLYGYRERRLSVVIQVVLIFIYGVVALHHFAVLTGY